MSVRGAPTVSSEIFIHICLFDLYQADVFHFVYMYISKQHIAFKNSFGISYKCCPIIDVQMLLILSLLLRYD